MDIAAELSAALECPPFPVAMSYLWRAWSRLRRRTPPGFNGPNPITVEAIDAFVRRTGLPLDPRDIEMIEAIDDLYLSSMAAQADERDKQQAVKDGLDRASPHGRRTVGK